MLDLTKFKTIPGFSKYKISEFGDVYSVIRNKIIASTKNWAGYVVVTLTDDTGFRSPRKVHRLVYITYVGKIDEDKVIDHKDDNKLNNHFSNLQQITPSENSTKSFISGKNKFKVKWTKMQIELICEMMEQNAKNVDIFKNLGIDYYSHRSQCNMLLGQLRRGEIHKDVSKKYHLSNYICGINRHDSKLDISDVRNIYMRLLFGDRASDLSKEYHVTHSSIRKIRDKKTWKHATDFVDQYFI